MHIRDLNGKNICILGFGKEGQSVLRALQKSAPDCSITIADRNPQPQLSAFSSPISVITGPDYLDHLEQFDVLIKSPGIPPNAQLDAQHSKLINSTQIFLDTVTEYGAMVIGVTGSKGKSTTATLLAEILTCDGRNTHLVGNIGYPALDALERSRRDVFFVMEMSSYQLMDVTRSPHIAVITSFFPEHLDYHASTIRLSSGQAALSTGSTPLKAYLDAKKNITRFQKPEDLVFFNAESDGAREIAEESKGKKIPFSPEDAPVKIEETHLLGKHNLGNMAAAWKVAEHLQVPRDTSLMVFYNFPGLPHRLQNLGVHHGMVWVDDAISTTPESTIAALDALGDRVTTVILGGQDRGNDFTELGKRIRNSKIQTVILFPGSGPRISKAIEDARAEVQFFEAKSMEEAVAHARSETAISSNQLTNNQQPSIVLLSTASPSYGMFKNFEEKGDLFHKFIVDHH